MPEIKPLPESRNLWTPRLIAEWCGVPERTVQYHCAQLVRHHKGRWKLDHATAQQVVATIGTYGQAKNKQRVAAIVAE